MAYEQLKLKNQLCFRLYTASRLINQTYEPFLKPLGITYTQYIVLMVLWEEDCQPVNEIGKKLMLGINTMSPLIKRMETLGLVTRRNSESDKRQQIVCLTPQGKELEAAAAKVPEQMYQVFNKQNLSTGALISLIPGLDEVLNKLGDPSRERQTTDKEEINKEIKS